MRLLEALDGQHGPEQQHLAQQLADIVDMLLRKNADYGSSVYQPPRLAPECDVDAAIRVRLSDKLERMETLLKQQRGPLVDDEPLRETVLDAVGYMLLWLAREGDGKRQELPSEPTLQEMRDWIEIMRPSELRERDDALHKSPKQQAGDYQQPGKKEPERWNVEGK